MRSGTWRSRYDLAPGAEWASCSLDELVVQASSTVDHAGSLGLLLLAACQGQSVIHVAFLVQHGLAVGGQRSQEGALLPRL